MSITADAKSPNPASGGPQNPNICLCAPSPEITCFACCPPIRPHHYDPLGYVGSLRREFLENRRRYIEEGPRYRPIVGYHCWALGFLDAGGRRVGCLLHPHQNQGRDLRFLIDYGSKCRRESCVPAQMFALLPPDGKWFWMTLVQGLNAFHFSSPRSNPLFYILLWGPDVLEPLRIRAEKMEWTPTELLFYHPFLTDPAWSPKGHRYLFRLAIESLQTRASQEWPIEEYCTSLRSLIRTLPASAFSSCGLPSDPYVQELSLEPDFSDFLRVGLGRQRVSRQAALNLKQHIERLSQDILMP